MLSLQLLTPSGKLSTPASKGDSPLTTRNTQTLTRLLSWSKGSKQEVRNALADLHNYPLPEPPNQHTHNPRA